MGVLDISIRHTKRRTLPQNNYQSSPSHSINSLGKRLVSGFRGGSVPHLRWHCVVWSSSVSFVITGQCRADLARRCALTNFIKWHIFAFKSRMLWILSLTFYNPTQVASYIIFLQNSSSLPVCLFRLTFYINHSSELVDSLLVKLFCLCFNSLKLGILLIRNHSLWQRNWLRKL